MFNDEAFVPVDEAVERELLACPAGLEYLRKSPYISTFVFENFLSKLNVSDLDNWDVSQFLFNGLDYALKDRSRRVEMVLEREDLMEATRNDSFRLTLNLQESLRDYVRSSHPNKKTVAKLAASAVPYASNAILASDAPLEVKLKAAPKAFRLTRALWLLTEASDLPEETVESILFAPDVLGEAYENTPLGNQATAETPKFVAGLLYDRPHLIRKAALSSDPALLAAASRSIIEPQDQDGFIDAVLKLAGTEKEYAEVFSASYSADKTVSPLHTLLSMPWCTPQSEERIMGLEMLDLTDDGTKISAYARSGSWFKKTIVDRSQPHRFDIRTVKPSELDGVLYYRYYVPDVVEGHLMTLKGWSDFHRREFRRNLRYGPRFGNMLKSRGIIKGRSFPEKLFSSVYGSSWPVVKEEKRPKPVKVDDLDSHLDTPLWQSERFVPSILKAELTPKEWPVALTLLKGFDRNMTARDLVDATKALN